VPESAAEYYRSRFLEVLEYIDVHLEERLTAEQLSERAGFSKFHFHRQFTAIFGVSMHRYTQLTRFKRAAYRLAFRHDSPVLEIAFASGYEGPEAFARAFKKVTGQSPSDFRRQPEWTAWHAAYADLRELRATHMKAQNTPDQVRIVDFPNTAVAVLEHRGDPNRMGDSIRKFIEWRKQNRLPPKTSATFNLLYDDPAQVEAEDFRLDLCAQTLQEIQANPFGVIKKTIPSGRCAVLRHVGVEESLENSIRWLYSQWLPSSGESPRDFPLFLQRLAFFPDVPEHEAMTDIFLPLR
jgi:AraC family transcriptional regulator